MSTPASLAPIRGHCAACGPNRLADVVANYRKHDEDESNGIWTETDYRILRCRGCEEVYFQTDSSFSEDADYRINPHTGEEEAFLPHKITYWPALSKREQPRWAYELSAVDSDLRSLFDDVYIAFDNDLRVLSAIGIRTVFDRASELLGVDPAKTFGEKLTELAQLGKIGTSEKDTLDVLADAGSAAAHRGWKPEPEELDTMTSIIEAFLYRAFILDSAAKHLKSKVPTKPKRKAT